MNEINAIYREFSKETRCYHYIIRKVSCRTLICIPVLYLIVRLSAGSIVVSGVGVHLHCS